MKGLLGTITILLFSVVLGKICHNEGYKAGRSDAGDYQEGYKVGYKNCELMQKIDADLKEYNDSIKAAEHGR
jgi:hypothetical protein